MSAVPDQREEAARLGEFVREVLVNSSSNIGAREAFDALLSELSRLQAERDELRRVLGRAKEEVARFRHHTEGRDSESSPLEDDIEAALRGSQ